MVKTVMLASVLFWALAGCGKEEKSENLKYQFEENGCDTGEHSASSKPEYCANLKNDPLNKFCASSLRKQAFESQGCGSW